MAEGDYLMKARRASYFNRLLLDDPLKLLRKYAIHPADNIHDYKGENLGSAHTSYVKRAPTGKFLGLRRALGKLFPALTPQGTWSAQRTVGHGQVSAARKVAFIKLERRGLERNGNEGAGTIDVTGQYNYASGLVPVYFLPWDQSGAIVELTIPKEGVIGSGSNALDPDFFFTAAINGCSIFFRGSQESPTIYHAGGDTGRGSDAMAAAAYWRSVITNFADASDGKGQFVSEVNKMDYIKTPGVDGGRTTKPAMQYQAWLENKYKDQLQIQLVSPWGCVMGVRDDGKWYFYLQENCTVVSVNLSKKGGSIPVKSQMVSRPLRVREVFPERTGVIDMCPAMPPQAYT